MSSGPFPLSPGLSLVLMAMACSGSNYASSGTDGMNAKVADDHSPYPGGENTWIWVPVAGTQCMNGNTTGMGVNYRPRSTKLMIYLEGGGACFNASTCRDVAHQHGFGPRDLRSFAVQLGAAGVFNRSDGDNPLAEYSFVFIPYCTGDVFAGANPNGFGGRNQVGYNNMGVYVDELVRTFGPLVDHVVLAGSSAGGLGAIYNFDRVQTAFGKTPVTLLADSGPLLSDAFLTPCLQKQVREPWGLSKTLPANCTECTQADGGGLSNLTSYLAEKYPNRRLGGITSTKDAVIREFYGWGLPNCEQPTVPMDEEVFAAGVAELAEQAAKHANLDLFVIDSDAHVWLLNNPLGGTVVADVRLSDWIRNLTTFGEL